MFLRLRVGEFYFFLFCWSILCEDLVLFNVLYDCIYVVLYMMHGIVRNTDRGF